MTTLPSGWTQAHGNDVKAAVYVHTSGCRVVCWRRDLSWDAYDETHAGNPIEQDCGSRDAAMDAVERHLDAQKGAA